MGKRFCPEKQNYTVYLDCQECESKMCEAFFCLVVGSRTFNDYSLMVAKLDNLLKKQHDIVIVSGGARGADALAERYAAERGYPCVVFPAKWDELGKAAGYIRNREMHEYLSHMDKRGCVAFWDGKSKGTAQNFELSREFHTDYKIVRF